MADYPDKFDILFNNFYGESVAFTEIPKEITIGELKRKISVRLEENLKYVLGDIKKDEEILKQTKWYSFD